MADVFKSGAEKRLYAGQKSLRETTMGGIKLFDLNAVNPGMQGAVLQVLAEFDKGVLSSDVRKALDITDAEIPGLSPEAKMKQAYKFADYTTERTQPMFSPEHRSSLSRGSTIEKLGTQFSSFTNQALNLIRRTYREAQRTNDPLMYAKLAKVLFLLLVINTGGVMMIDNLRNWLYRRLDRKGYGEAILDSVASYFYFVRDVERSVVSKVKYGTYRGYDISLPILSMGNILGDALGEGFGMLLETDPEKKRKLAFSFIDSSLVALSMSTGIPYQTPKKIITRGGRKPPAKKPTKLKNPVLDKYKMRTKSGDVWKAHKQKPVS